MYTRHTATGKVSWKTGKARDSYGGMLIELIAIAVVATGLGIWMQLLENAKQ